ncbi:3-dehydroquinate synthase [Bdellovibrionota bacterium FG-1]
MKLPYHIQIGAGAIRGIGKCLARAPSRRAFLISDVRLIEPRAALKSALAAASWEVFEIPVEAGESLKDIQAIYPLYGKLLDGKANRDSVIFALGGGTVGDAAGFVASTYLRGIPWVGVPTTLLAQVDSSVGGKTGINHSAGKNLIGSFHPPQLVICDTDFLRTLGSREIISGFGEVVKYGIAFDPKFFSYLEKNREKFMAMDPQVIAYSIERSLFWKCKMVARDEFDRKGIREALNLGHTFGHALESLTDYKVFQHGEAVLWGMRFALALSKVRRRLAAKTRDRVDTVLASIPIPTIPRRLKISQLIACMKKDKKIRDGKIHFVLLKELGRTFSDGRVQEEDLKTAFKLLKEST